jgi:amino acid adenylation domain-containing protein
MTEIENNDIAIVGMSCRFPGARSVEAYRDMLLKGRCEFRHLTLDEVVAAGVPYSIAVDSNYIKIAAPLEGIDEFDTEAFKLTPAEVAVIDPQHYHFLECTYEALHEIGFKQKKSNQRIGIYAGADLSYYAMKRMKDDAIWDPMGHWQDIISNDSHFLATSISYRLGLTGPSVGVQTACSTSLVAVHMALQALISGDCDVAVAGGVSIRGNQNRGYLYRDGSILSPTGTCRPFDKDADGTVLSSGVGVVVLMRLQDALNNKIPLWAVIKGSAVNNDGNRKVGYTAPSVEGQAAVISEALSVAGFDPKTIGYIEAHGTGTKLGDPIEHRALASVYKSSSRNARYIGSVKSNFGHLESAAGVAGLIKAILSVRFGEIYPSLGYVSPNPEIDWTQSSFKIADHVMNYPDLQSPRRAAVSSFGIGGTNCHVLIEEPHADDTSIGGLKVPVFRTYPFKRRKIWTPPSMLLSPIENVQLNITQVLVDNKSILMKLWNDVIGKMPEPDDCFLAVGGDSIKAAQLAGKIKENLGTDIPILDILEIDSFSDLVKLMTRESSNSDEIDFPLSINQQSLWLWQSLEKTSPAYTSQAVFRLSGTLDINSLKQAFYDLVQRQDALRSSFFGTNGQVRQKVMTYCNQVPWCFRETSNDPQELSNILKEHGQTVIDLVQPPLLSVLLIRIGVDSFFLSVLSHHIVSDEWSAQIMLGDVLEFYIARIERRQPALENLRTTMGLVAQNEQVWVKSGAATARKDYWRSKLSEVTRFELPYDRPRRHTKTYVGGSVPFELSERSFNKVKSLASAYKSTPFMVLATAFKILWLRYTGQSDLCIGTNIAGREENKATDVVGLFTNTVALRTNLSGNPTFVDALQRVRKTAIEAYDHQLPFQIVIDVVQPLSIPFRNPFFDIMFVLQNVPRRMKGITGLEVESVPFHNGTSKFDLELALEESRDGALNGRWEYDSELFDKETIERFSVHYKQILESVINDPFETVSQIKMISTEEQTTLLNQWNQTEIDFGIRDRSLWEIFCDQVQKDENALAIISAEGNTTYGTLLHQSVILASELRKAGVKPQDLVGVFCDRSESYIQAILAIQACGAAFLPLDPTIPDARLTDMLRDAKVRNVVTRKNSEPRFGEILGSISGQNIHAIMMEEINDVSCEQNLPFVPVSELAYVIYTSGSTGKPKGAMVSHAGMLNHLHAKIKTLGINHSTRMAFTAPVCFDISIWQCLAPILVGGTVVIIRDDDVMEVGALFDRLNEERVEIVELVPSYIDVLLGHLEHINGKLSHLKYLVATGEKLPAETCRRWFNLVNEIPIVNAYGPTECSDDVLQYVIREKPPADAASIPVGYALPNTKTYILDESQKPVPIGAVGEIYVGGVCVGLGYLNDPQKSADVFLQDIFTDHDGSMLYKTGDLARRRIDGAIEYLGRRDNQVKFHGVRLEIEEIEAVMRDCLALDDIAVAVSSQGDSLIALISNDYQSNGSIDARYLHKKLEGRLPGVMIPSTVQYVKRIPKTSSGKTDRSEIDGIVRREQEKKVTFSKDIISFSTEPLTILQEAWKRVLNCESVSLDAHFFDFGGDSLKAIRLTSIVQRAGLAIIPADIYANPVLRDLVEICGSKEHSIPQKISSKDPGETIHLTKGEKWFLDQELPDAHLCDSAFLLRLSSKTPLEKIESAIDILWRNHDNLRAKFVKTENAMWQKVILPISVPCPFSFIDISSYSPELTNQIIFAERNRETRNSRLLFRATLFRCDEIFHLLVVAHYLACDAVSWQLLLDEFKEIILAVSIVFGPDEKFISNQLSSLDFEPSRMLHKLPIEKTIGLLSFANVSNISVEILLTSLFAYATSYIYNKRVVQIALGRHGRVNNVDLQNESKTIGRFAFPYLIEIEVNESDTMNDVIYSVTKSLSKNYNNMQYSVHQSENEPIIIGLDYLGEITTKVLPEIMSIPIMNIGRRQFKLLSTTFRHEVIIQIINGELVIEIRSVEEDNSVNQYLEYIIETINKYFLEGIQ